LTDDKITLDGQNLEQLTTKDVVDSIKTLGSFGMMLSGFQEGDVPNGNA
jgi:hypothetical protein